MNAVKRGQRLVAEINITPFTDVILVLLVIFMITTPLLSQSGMDVELPKASSAQALNAKTDVLITITKEGAVYLEGRVVTREELKERMGSVKRYGSNVAVILNIDEGVQFKNVVSVLDVLRGLGIKNFNIAAKT